MKEFINGLFLFILTVQLVSVTACGRTDFDSNYIPDAGTDAHTDTDTVNKGCGNGILENGEECDKGSANSNDSNAYCRPDCTLGGCGDNIVDTNTEVCDLGENNSDEPDAACRTNCTFSRCGDGIIDLNTGDGTPEECDDGGLNSDEPGANCRTNCKLPYCGDGIVDDASEECDLGDLNSDTGACTIACTIATCGDGYIQAGVEKCDDGDNISDLLCSGDCQHSCGDGVVDSERGEQCDDGAQNSDIIEFACRTNCQVANCNDSVWDSHQLCLDTPDLLKTTGTPTDITHGDISGDGTEDLVLVTSTAVYAFVKNEHGYVETWHRSGMSSPISPMINDFNGDGIKDIAVIETTTRKVTLFTGQGNGTFNSPQRTSTGSTQTNGRAVTGEFSGDTNPDIAVLTPFGNEIVLMTNNGNGTFSSSTISTCQRPLDIVSGNLDSDTNEDFAIVCNISNIFAIYHNDGAGSFTVDYNTASDFPKDIEISDMNGDALNDIIVLKDMQASSLPEVTIYFQQSNGSFSGDTNISNLTSSSHYVQVADFDGDLLNDIMISDDTGFTMYENDGIGGMTLSDIITWSENPGVFLWKDLTGNKKADLIAGGGTSAGFTGVIYSLGFPLPHEFTIPAPALKGTSTDFNGDQKIDSILLSNDNRMFVVTGDGNGNFLTVTPYALNGASEVSTIGDPVNSDILVSRNQSSTASIIANPNGVLSSNVDLDIGGSTPKAAIGGLLLNSDSFYDSAVLFEDTAQVSIIFGGATPSVSSFHVGLAPVLFASGDLDGDGDIDFIVLDGDGLSLYALLGDGNGSFFLQSAGQLNSANPVSIALADLNIDGISQLQVAYSNGTITSYDINLSLNSVSLVNSLVVPCGLKTIYSSDQDNNGANDIMAICSNGESIYWLYEDSSSTLKLYEREKAVIPSFSNCISCDLTGNMVSDYLCLSQNQSIIPIITRP